MFINIETKYLQSHEGCFYHESSQMSFKLLYRDIWGPPYAGSNQDYLLEANSKYFVRQGHSAQLYIV